MILAISWFQAAVELYLLFQVFQNSVEGTASGDVTTETSSAVTTNVKIGFLVGSQRLKNGELSFSRPGRQLIYAFNFSIDKVNQLYSSSGKKHLSHLPAEREDQLDRINFLPVIGETYGNESESIRQTIELINKQQVNVIVGPQESCQIESKLASVFSTAMVSYYCSHWTPLISGSGQVQVDLLAPMATTIQPASSHSTLIQTKPPHWKIAERVVTLVSHLIQDSESSSNIWYPQQLVLLYFKEAPAYNKRSSTGTGESAWNSMKDSTYLTSDALQYKLIGELLEIQLNELLSGRQGKGKGKGEQELRQNSEPQRALTVLNWSTIFHYGYTKNPFLRIIRRNQIQVRQQQQQQHRSLNLPDSQQCIAARAASRSASSLLKTESAAIYIVVGHYYEHLGLMLALDELNLLGKGAEQPEEATKRPSVVPINQQSLVIGVDIEQYDERYDSARFLRGLLMDYEPKGAGEQHQHPHQRAALDSDSVANMYRHYVGVVPARLTRMAEFLYDMRSVHLRSQQQPLDEVFKEKMAKSANQTVEAGQLTARLFQLIRLPVEAFYLYDAVLLIGAYFNECLRELKLKLAECSEGRRVFDWFKGREYSSFVDDNLTRFDSSAQSEGSFTLIARRFVPNDAQSAQDLLSGEDDFGFLAPVGRFVNTLDELSGRSHKLELYVNSSELDPIWLPFWCQVKQQFNQSHCDMNRFIQVNSSDPDNDKMIHSSMLNYLLLFFSIFLLFTLFSLSSYYRFPHHYHSQVNSGWFSEEDERNFLTIIHKFLITPEILTQTQDILEKRFMGCKREQYSLVELHCYMFSFPSCKFVHWLTALHQLKELMFKYQSRVDEDDASSRRETFTLKSLFSALILSLRRRRKYPEKVNARGFFVNKHKGTATLRLLLNKYRMINASFCALTELDHEAVAKLLGVSLTYTGASPGESGEQSKSVRLVVEQPIRGNLRDTFRLLNENIPREEAVEFRNSVTRTLLNDLLNGLDYLHQSKIQFHGELRASTCMLTVDWRLKLSGFHAFHMRYSLGGYEQQINVDQEQHLDSLLYSAPEVLEKSDRRGVLSAGGLKLADIYSFAFVLYELLTDREPWSCLTEVRSSKLIVERVRCDSSFRPPIERISFFRADVEPQKERTNPVSGWLDLNVIGRVLRSCWSHLPERRPSSVEQLRLSLEQTHRISSSCFAFAGGQVRSFDFTGARKKSNSSSGQVMSCYAQLLESVSRARGQALALEREQSRELKLSHLPERLASRFSVSCSTKVEQVAPVVEQFECVSVCVFRFILSPELDIHQSAAEECKLDNPLDQLSEIIVQLNRLVHSYQRHIHLLDSQVDSSLRYLAYAGEPLARSPVEQQELDHPQLLASFALQLIELANRLQCKLRGSVQVRCGLHCGPLDAALVWFPSSSTYQSLSNGLPRYVLLGSTIQVADALEASSPGQRIQISSQFRAQLLQRQLGRQIPAGRRRTGRLSTPTAGISQLSTVQSSTSFCAAQTSYVMVKREGKIHSKLLAGDLEAYWLLNGPRLTSGQSLMLSSG